MAFTAVIVAAVGATAATGASLHSANKAQKQQAKAADSQRTAQRAQQRQAELRQARSRRQAVREARLARSAAIQAGVSSGAGVESSRAQSSAGSVTAQGAANVSFLDTQQGLADVANSALVDASIFQSRANRFTSQANTASAVGSIFQQGGSIAAGQL